MLCFRDSTRANTAVGSRTLSEDANLEWFSVLVRFRVRNGLTGSGERVSAHGV